MGIAVSPGRTIVVEVGVAVFVGVIRMFSVGLGVAVTLVPGIDVAVEVEVCSDRVGVSSSVGRPVGVRCGWVVEVANAVDVLVTAGRVGDWLDWGVDVDGAIVPVALGVVFGAGVSVAGSIEDSVGVVCTRTIVMVAVVTVLTAPGVAVVS